MNTIQIIGDINEEAFAKFDEELREQEVVCYADEDDVKAVNVTLSSGGGSAYDALAFFDRMKSSLLDIHVTCYGTCFSAAVIILAGGDFRRMTANSWVMVHEDTTGVSKNDKVYDAEKKLLHGRALENQWNKLLSEVSLTSQEEWARLHREETYLTAQECLTLGLIDEVL